ncbi:F-box-like WD repeat-containing TBL1XR1 [Chlorella sorokiniana]|jgi:transducin (beta)-like 1|uniref:F-box-like WD repeat-containing TBL1XR1 n=1 Tax=Chlorella sorokiniana TaxID=3076 RepID=A0A2P6TLG9_CHLSO|nr:F-box-like WD repeat-containing TBL1XR1 [Chlorella sorokiniana]|eukprot:PRW45142.1 F-box-like WD repeat-containing TBL1XR1 [Chlorella sorokiniana]
MSLTSDEVNFLVYRYLLEAGFTHAAFVFGAESSITKSGINGKEVPVGALVSFIQKGFQYMELEANLNEEGTDVYGEYTPLQARDILVKDIDELKVTVREMKEAAQQEQQDFLAAGPKEIPEFAIRRLAGHSQEVICLAWCPTSNLLASASSDGTARIWDLQDTGSSGSGRVCVCRHAPQGGAAGTVELTCLEWSPDGQALATGASDNAVRLFSREGVVRSLLAGHRGMVMAVRWNKRGDLLLSGSLDGSLIVWDAKAGQQSKAYSHHGAPIVDADWRNNTMFASCSQDGSIAVCKLSDGKPLRHWQGAHSADINSLRWEPSGKLLASCSDDGTVKVWQATSDKPVHTLSGHVGSVTAVRWGQSSSGKSHLASCGDDGSVRVWDAEAGACVHVFDEHASAVTLIAWSPDATYLASGDASGRLLVWSLRSGGVVRSMQAPSTVYDLRFNKDSSLLACCTSETQPILVADLRRQA